MSKILALALSGFGKTISAAGCQEPEQGVNIVGLPPASTYFISATSKDLPGRGSRLKWPTVIPDAELANLSLGRRVITKDPYQVARIIEKLSPITAITDIVIDDTNYWMQDYMMAKSLATGWDAPKKVGHFMSQIFEAIEIADMWGKNIWMLSHYDEKKKDNKGNISFKMKTTGNTTNDMITPEGKFDIVLYGISEFNDVQKKVVRYYLTTDDGTFVGKSDPGMFPAHIPNDFDFVKRSIEAYRNGLPMPSTTVEVLQHEIPATVTVPVNQTPGATPEESGV